MTRGKTPPLASLLALCNPLGFDADLERRGTALRIRQRNGIFVKTAQADPALLCQ